PARAVPFGDAEGGPPAGRGEVAPRVEGGAGGGGPAFVEDGEGVHGVVHPVAQRRPARAVPLGDAVGGHTAGRGEVAPRVEGGAGGGGPAVVEAGEGGPEAVHPAAQRCPARAVPLGDAVGGPPAGRGEVAPRVEGGAGGGGPAFVEDGEGEH